MKTEQPPVIRLVDYTPPTYAVEKVDLTFDLAPRETIVTSVLEIRRAEGATGPLTLDGEDLDLRNIALDGRNLTADDMTVTETGLTLADPPSFFTLATIVAIDPVDNTRLEGLYQSNGNYCTQCEAEGFRRITFFPDRPDVMSVYRVTLRASKEDCPILLSNGNSVSTRDLPDGRHESVWLDPFPKPSYLFALVAGKLQAFNDRFRTKSGRDVALHIWVEHGNGPRAEYAMDALKRSMKWDEDRFGLEYDLDVFNIVAVSDFNMGAMENKSLNVFNAKYILADPETATDADYANIEAIVGHEYFHNWTGNRVTCRDWFQLSLKEGLTVFRDQEFSADMRSRAVKRIQDVRMLRARQFPEDAGPLAHPVRPDSYMEINNFYTATIYEKGAEVIRMLHAMLGEDGFQDGMKLYFERHDGQAVTCDDFVAAMADATGADLTAFKAWYSQAGTPEVSVSWTTDPSAGTTLLRLKQTTAPTPGQDTKVSLPIPLAMGLLDDEGRPVPLQIGNDHHGDEMVLTLSAETREVVFQTGDRRDVIPSLNRGFSAPISLTAPYLPEARARLMAHDTDPFARWEAGQQYATELLLAMVGDLREGRDIKIDTGFIHALGAILANGDLDPAFRALSAALPSEDYLAERMRPVAIDEIHEARATLRRTIGATLRETFAALHADMASDGAYDPGAAAAGRRSLRNSALAYLCAADDADAAALALDRFRTADNMTDRMAALSVLSDMSHPGREEALSAFHDRFKEDEQVMDKWLSVQSTSARPDTLDRVRELLEHPVFSMRKPNKVRALIGAFAMANPVRFHAADGAGYDFVADKLIELDALNPQVAARLLGAFGQWRRLPADRSRLMRGALERIAGTDGLSRDCTEIATKSLAG